MRSNFDSQFEHVLSEQGHPGGPVCLFEVAARRQWGASVEHADVVQTQESALEHVFAETVLPVYPPGEVQQKLIERSLEKINVGLTTHGQFCVVEEEGCPGMDWGIDVAKIPLIGRDLPARMQIIPMEH